MTRPAAPPEPHYLAAYREADRLAACLLLDAEQLTHCAAQALDAQHRTALRAAHHGEYVDLCDLLDSLSTYIETEGPEMRARHEDLGDLDRQETEMVERLAVLERLGRAEGWR